MQYRPWGGHWPRLVKQKGLQKTLEALLLFWWRGMDLNHGPSGYAYHYSFHCLTHLSGPFDGLDCPFTLDFTLGCLPSSLYTFPVS